MSDAKPKKNFFAEIEEDLLATWEEEKTFQKSLENRKDGQLFNFNDGPPFANGLPHFGHSLVTGIKDSILRYKTMRGYFVPRRNGWDCHGLPVEFAIEKEFGVSGKKQIQDLGLEKFNAACRDSIFRYKADWETFLKRYGRWSDYKNHYATVDTDYTESVWWVLGEINKKKLLYKGFKSLPYCPRCATPLSNFELSEGYKDNVPDPSVFALFGLKGEPGTSFLAWTTTPWTLPANAALAVNQNADYATIELKSDGSKLILAKDRLDVLDLRTKEYKLLKTTKGKDLVGLSYEPLYCLPSGQFEAQAKNAHKVLSDPSVSLEEGTGILHVAPRYGEADLALGQANDLPLIESVDSSGHQVYGPAEALGKFFKSADEYIIADLTRKGRIFAAEIAEHTYPFCWRCETPLMYFATTTWFVEVTKVKDELIKTAQQINWVPTNIKSGRFGKWLEGSRDWAISRNRYWGAPMPIWVNTKDEDDYIVVSSKEELKQLAGDNIKVDDLHRPFIDEISFTKNGKTYKRVEEVLDCWFESGSMPVAQWHYPFENKESASKLLTADFITEGLDQTRLWFYVQHVISTILFNRPAYKNVIVTGMLMAADGQKLSKRLKNYPPTDEVFENEGADAWRLYLLSSTQATETADYMRFNRDAVTDLQRNVLGTLLNSFRFFRTYAQIDKWQPAGLDRPQAKNVLDQWILARLDETTQAVTKSADDFKIAHAIEPTIKLVDDLSNWYIRRSRRRFWKSEDDTDKQEAYAVLFYSLMRTCQLLAPFAPFLSDYIWRELSKGTDLPQSVHLSDWPVVTKLSKVSHEVLQDMAKVKDQVITEGLSQRAVAGIKVRQPLAKVTINLKITNKQAIEGVILDELNVKQIEWVEKGATVLVDVALTDELKTEGLARDLIRSIQSARKKAGFNVEDRIHLTIESEAVEVTKAVATFGDLIFSETLAQKGAGKEAQYAEEIELEGHNIVLKLART